jgi:hypothetical protein
MAVTGGIAAIVSASAGIAGAVNANQQAQHTKGAAQATAQQAQAQTAAERTAATNAASTATADATRDQAEQRQKQIIAGAQGAGSTILTSGFGVLQPAPTAGKTLLGS